MTEGSAHVEIADGNGNIVFSWIDVTVSNGKIKLRLKISDMQDELYFAHVKINGQAFTPHGGSKCFVNKILKRTK